jgi:phosphoribosyl-dephospho-CoA transferase
MDVIVIANCKASCTVDFFSIPAKMLRVENESGVGRIMDLDTLVPDLMKAYRTSPVGGHDGHRLLALSALINIGNAASLEHLVADSSDPSSRQSDWVKRNTQRSLIGFYLAKYPELTERAARNKTFSLDDVRRAETVRVRLAKKEAKTAAGN